MKTKQKRIAKTPKKKFYEKWQSWLAFISAIVVLLGAITNLPEKFIGMYKTVFPSNNFDTTTIIIKVRDRYTNLPIQNSQIEIKSLGIKNSTDKEGFYRLSIDNLPHNRNLIISVSKEKYQSLNDTIFIKPYSPNIIEIGLKETPIQDF